MATLHCSCDTAGVSDAVRSLVYSFSEYVALEDYSNVRHEFRGGSILAMAGGSPEHAALCAACSALLVQGVTGKGCVVHSSDLRVRVQATGLATYPDVSVVCGPRELDPQDRNTVLNPRVLVEVTSPSSEEYDRGEKRENYQQIAALFEYAVISHEQRQIGVWRREGASWVQAVARKGERISLDSIGVEIDVDRVYDIAAVPC